MTQPGTSVGGIWKLAAGRRDAKSPLRQVAEMAALYALRGIGPGFYQLVGFFDRRVTWREMARYVSPRDYEKIVTGFNDPAYHKLSQSKVVEKAILRLFRIPATELIGVLNANTGRTVAGGSLRSADDLAAFLETVAPRRICFKASEGWGGSSFRAVSLTREGDRLMLQDLKTGDAVTPQAFYDSLRLDGDRSWVVEEMMEQHPALAALNPTSINTMRIWVVDHGKGPEARLAYLRIGRAGSLVDNHSSGGIIAPLDIATGELHAATDGTVARRIFTHHPDSGAAIAGATVPLFAEAKKLAEDCLAVFPHINFAGLDIALSPAGPVIIEMNVSPDLLGGSLAGIPTGDALAP